MRTSFNLIIILLLILISLVHALIRTIPPSTTLSTTTTTEATTTTSLDRIEPLVDRIEAIDVSSTQVIIQTSKVGPTENARVSIEVIDLGTGEKLPPVHLVGILLTITRGK